MEPVKEEPLDLEVTTESTMIANCSQCAMSLYLSVKTPTPSPPNAPEYDNLGAAMLALVRDHETHAHKMRLWVTTLSTTTATGRLPGGQRV